MRQEDKNYFHLAGKESQREISNGTGSKNRRGRCQAVVNGSVKEAKKMVVPFHSGGRRDWVKLSHLTLISYPEGARMGVKFRVLRFQRLEMIDSEENDLKYYQWNEMFTLT